MQSEVQWQSNLQPPSNATLQTVLTAAEDSSQYKSFAANAGVTPTIVPDGPALEARGVTQCSEFEITAYAYNFIAGGLQISIPVSPEQTR